MLLLLPTFSISVFGNRYKQTDGPIHRFLQTLSPSSLTKMILTEGTGSIPALTDLPGFSENINCSSSS